MLDYKVKDKEGVQTYINIKNWKKNTAADLIINIKLGDILSIANYFISL